jgi:hypothetical protein
MTVSTNTHSLFITSNYFGFLLYHRSLLDLHLLILPNSDLLLPFLTICDSLVKLFCIFEKPVNFTPLYTKHLKAVTHFALTVYLISKLSLIYLANLLLVFVKRLEAVRMAYLTLTNGLKLHYFVFVLYCQQSNLLSNFLFTFATQSVASQNLINERTSLFNVRVSALCFIEL